MMGSTGWGDMLAVCHRSRWNQTLTCQVFSACWHPSGDTKKAACCVLPSVNLGFKREVWAGDGNGG